MEKQDMIFITGGARSGKSTFAEQQANQFAQKKQLSLTYVATSRVEDEEMKHRIQRHQQERAKSRFQWETIECPEQLERVVEQIDVHSVVLVDCLTILLTNELFSTRRQVDDWQRADGQEAIFTSILDGIQAIRQKASVLIVVSNEVLHEKLGNQGEVVHVYARLLGRLHQNLARQADVAYLLESGVPLCMKGF